MGGSIATFAAGVVFGAIWGLILTALIVAGRDDDER